MINKTAKVQDVEANKVKSYINTQAANLIGVDMDEVRKDAKAIADSLQKELGTKQLKIVITGGAGSGKTTVAGALATELGLKVFDFDEYIPGGWTEDKKEYERRFNKGLYELWEDCGSLKKGYIIEHVEACHPDLVGLYRPDVAILVHPEIERLRKAAEARSAITGKSEGRLERSLQSDKKATRQFNDLGGTPVYDSRMNKLQGHEPAFFISILDS